MSSLLQIFHELAGPNSRLGIYTMENKEQIPESSGCYAWFLPLWLYSENLEELLEKVGSVLNPDFNNEKQIDMPFTWETINLKARRNTLREAKSTMQKKWARVIKNHEIKDAIQQILLEASVLMPPLYVGRTQNLKKRYHQHIEGGSSEENNFHNRFSEQVREIELLVEVSDLLFVCVRTSLDSSISASDNEALDGLLEQVLMRFCRPSFSLR